MFAAACKTVICDLDLSDLSDVSSVLLIIQFKLGDSKAFDIAFNEGTEGRFCKQYDIFKNTPDGIFPLYLSSTFCLKATQ
jgi:hypothetical protein